MVDRLIRMAPIAGASVMPAQASAPAASGMDTMLYPAAQARFWRILRYDALDNLMTPMTEAVECWLTEGIETAMNRFNR